MARAKKTGTEIANYDEELAALARGQVESENTAGSGGGRFFSTRAGVLSYEDAQLPGNQMVGIILDGIMENIYYEGKFDPDNRQPPTCFGFGRDAEAITVHENVFKFPDAFSPQCGPEGGQPENPEYLCHECPMNQWGTAETGRGKACQNRRRLAIIPGGSYTPVGRGGGFDLHLFEDVEDFAKADIAYMKLPVMSVKGYASYLKQISEQFQRPLFAVFTRIYLEPDPKSQFRVRFELIEPVPNELIPTLLARHKQAQKEIEFAYTPFTEDDENGSRRDGGGGKANSAKKLSRGGAAGGKKTSARKR